MGEALALQKEYYTRAWSLGRPRGLEEGVKVVNYLCPNWKCVEKGATADKRHCVLLLLPGWARGVRVASMP